MFSVVTDFDGTILKYDLPALALEKFGRRGWKRYEEILVDGKINVEQCVTKQYAMMNVRSREQVLDYIGDFCQFRPGFDKLLSECKSEGVSLTIVSAGLDFCIRRAFQKEGLTPPRLVCPKSSLIAGKGFKLRFPPHHYATSKDFKEDMVVYHQKQGNTVIFMGDGAGDFDAAARADVLFTIDGSTLDAICKQREIGHRPIRTLVPVQSFIQKMSTKAS